MESTDKNSLFLRYKKRFQYKQRLWNILSIVYTVILIPLLKLLEGTDYGMLWRMISVIVSIALIGFKAEQVNEKAAWRLVRKCG